MFKLARDMENAGIAFANHPLTIFAENNFNPRQTTGARCNHTAAH